MTSNDVVLVSLLLTLYIVLVNSIEFEQVNAGWAEPLKKGVFKNSCFVKYLSKACGLNSLKNICEGVYF